MGAIERAVSGPQREALWASVLVLAAVGAVKHGAQAVGGLALGPVSVADLLFTLHAAFTLYFPVLRVGRNGVSFASLGLVLGRWRAQALGTAVLMVATTALYGGAFWLWATWHGQAFRLVLPSGFFEQVLVEVALVGLSEELMFRGYLQERWATWFSGGRPPTRSGWIAVAVASAVFALAHFVGDYRPARLLTFFPGLLFGALRFRYGSIAGAIAFHAFCNLLQDVLFASFR